MNAKTTVSAPLKFQTSAEQLFTTRDRQLLKLTVSCCAKRSLVCERLGPAALSPKALASLKLAAAGQLIAHNREQAQGVLNLARRSHSQRLFQGQPLDV